MALFNEEMALLLSKQLLQNDKNIKDELDEKINNIQVTGKECNYTGTSSVDFGGIKKGQSFDKVNLQQMFDVLLNPYTKPSMTLGINPAKTIYNKVEESLSSITINANVTKKSEDISIIRFFVDNVKVSEDTTHPSGGLISYTHNFSTPTNKTFTVKIEVEDINGVSSKVSAQTTINFVGASFYGIVEDPDDKTPFDITENIIKNLQNKNVKITKALTYEGQNATYGRTIYAYPKDLPSGGLLTSIKDKKSGFDMSNSYSHKELTVNEIKYVCYYLTDAAGFTDVTTIFE